MFNADRVFAHRGLILTALTFYAKQVEKIKKLENEAELSSEDADQTLGTIEILKSEFVDQQAMQLEGTPLGDMLAGVVMRADDGAPLTVDALDERLRSMGIDAPFDHISAWTLDQRKQAHAWMTETQRCITDGEFPPPLLDILSPDWRKDSVLEQPLSEDEIDAAITRGPWRVRGAPGISPDVDEWVVFKEGEGRTIEHPLQYGQLDRARLIAANLNLVEGGRALTATGAGAVDLGEGDEG